MLHDISFPIWRRLFSLGFDFLELKPWEWMEEDMMFGVVQPENGEVGYCVILGKSHPSPGLAIFKGAKGLHSYLSLWNTEKKVNITDCILLSFEPLDKFWKEEKELFEWLEMESEASFPLIRDHEKGMEAWPLEDEEEARLVMFAIEQSISMAIRFKSERMLSAPNDAEHHRILFRVPFRKGAMLLWKDQWQEVKNEYETGAKAQANKLFLRSNCQNLPVKAQRKWLMEIFTFPKLKRPISQRPYYPYVLIVVDPDEKNFIGEFMFQPPDLHEHLQIRIKDLLVLEGYLPGTFQLVGEESLELVSDIADELQIKKVLIPKAPQLLEEMKARLVKE